MPTLQDILLAANLTGMINEIAGGVPDDLLPPGLQTPTRTIAGDQGTFFKVQNSRRLSKRKARGSVAVEGDKEPETEIVFKAIYSNESFRYKPDTLQNLLSEDGMRQAMGMNEVRRQATEHVRHFKNLRMSAVYSVLATGAINFTANGDLKLVTSAVNIDFGVPAGHKAQLNVFGTGDIISVSWDDPTADIATQMKVLRRAARKETGLPIMHALYGENILNYLLDNNQAKELINRSERRRDEAAILEIPQDFFKLTWWDVNEAFFEDTDGTLPDFFGPDDVVFIPAVSEQWWDYPEGTNIVPSSVGNVHQDAVAAMSDVQVMAGLSSYATVTANPVGVEQIIQDTFMPILRNPNAIFIATVKF